MECFRFESEACVLFRSPSLDLFCTPVSFRNGSCIYFLNKRFDQALPSQDFSAGMLKGFGSLSASPLCVLAWNPLLREQRAFPHSAPFHVSGLLNRTRASSRLREKCPPLTQEPAHGLFSVNSSLASRRSWVVPPQAATLPRGPSWSSSPQSALRDQNGLVNF